MATRLDTTAMTAELTSAGVVLDFTDQLCALDEYNYIIHMYDIIFLPISWQFPQETAEVCCALKRGGMWQKRNAWRY